jgi:hypothetical protein
MTQPFAEPLAEGFARPFVEPSPGPFAEPFAEGPRAYARIRARLPLPTTHFPPTPRDFCPPARLGPYRASAAPEPDGGGWVSHDPERPCGPCRLCAEPSWFADARGPVHHCCARAEAEGLTRCGPCAVSREARRRWEANHPPVTGDGRAGGRR